MDTWPTGVLLAVLAFLHAFWQIDITLLNVVSLHLTTINDLKGKTSFLFFIPSISSHLS